MIFGCSDCILSHIKLQIPYWNRTLCTKTSIQNINYYICSIYVCAYVHLHNICLQFYIINTSWHIRRTINSCRRHSIAVMMYKWKPNCFFRRCMTCYKVLNVVNARALCVLPVGHTPILISLCYLMKCLLHFDAVDHIYKIELSIYFELGVVSLPLVQPTVLFKIHFSCSTTLSVKDRCR
jgi:hypothetical protein